MPSSPRARPERPARVAGQPVASRPRQPNRRRRRVDPRRLFLLVGLLLTVPVVITLRWGAGCPWGVGYLLAVNLTTVVLYGYDKRAAIAGRLRVPERTLHTWALFGGTPAAFASQRVFRHKTLKGRFLFWFWAIFIVQVVLVAAWWLYGASHA